MPRVFQNVVYLQIRRRWVGIRFIGWSGRFGEWEGTPESVIGVNRDGSTYALSTSDPRILSAFNPRAFVAFSHPRILVDSFENTEKTLRLLLQQACRRRRMKGTFVVHVRDEWLGGVSDLEQRALIELVRNLGATRTLLIEGGRELSVPEVLELARTSRTPLQDVAVLAVPR